MAKIRRLNKAVDLIGILLEIELEESHGNNDVKL